MLNGDFCTMLLGWFGDKGRRLPWRGTKNPYIIWVSEVILQQTRIAQGTDYFLRFIAKFPTVECLAAASEDDVLKCWQGLGYYSRARNLHEAARSVVSMGGFPVDYAGVRALKGVGDYTAAAICSIAYGLPYPVVDGNVYRVLSRFFGKPFTMDNAKGKKEILTFAGQLLHGTDAGTFNEAVMELGEMVCLPQTPLCGDCPLKDKCVALAKNLTGQLPLKRHKVAQQERFFTYLLMTDGSHLLIHKRNGGGIWKNLYELPLIETSRPIEDIQSVVNHPAFISFVASAEVSAVSFLEKGVKHLLTHRIICADLVKVELCGIPTSLDDYAIIAWSEMDDYAFPRLIERFLEKYRAG